MSNGAKGLILQHGMACVCRRGWTFVVLVISVLLAACSHQPQPEILWPSAQTPVNAKDQSPRQEPPVAVAESVVAQLLEQAESNRQQQDWHGVIEVAEQGLRINRRLAQWYVLLAESYLAMQQPQVADAFVKQGQRYCRSASSGCVELRHLQQQISAMLDR